VPHLLEADRLPCLHTGTTCASHDERRHGRHIDRAAPVAACADDIDGLLGNLGRQRNRRCGVTHRAQKTTQFIVGNFALVVRNEKPKDVLGRHLPLQYCAA